MPAAASVCATYAEPDAEVPELAISVPSCLSSSSAVKLSLWRSIQLTIAASGGDSSDASGSSSPCSTPVPAPPAT